MFAAGDQLLKGAARNAVQVAEHLRVNGKAPTGPALTAPAGKSTARRAPASRR
jgi:hypothetical protein